MRILDQLDALPRCDDEATGPARTTARRHRRLGKRLHVMAVELSLSGSSEVASLVKSVTESLLGGGAPDPADVIEIASLMSEEIDRADPE